MTITIGMLAGEPSGDILGAGLIRALKVHNPNLKFIGIGGPLMIAEGCQSLYEQNELSVMGFIEPLKRLPRLIQIRHQIFTYFLRNKPALFIGIDSPDFNIGLERKLRQHGIKTVHYVSPSVWAWRQNRIYKIAKAVDCMLTLLPFEAAFYRQHQVPVEFVGHPLADQIPFEIDKLAARQSLSLLADKKIIALLPGSRRQELKYLGKTYLEAASIIHRSHPEIIFVTSMVNAEREQQWLELVATYAPDLDVKTVIGRSREVMAAADVALVTSGTATLECLLHKLPMVIAYKTSAFNYFIGKRLIKTPFIGLPNLLAGRHLVAELIQNEATGLKLAQELMNLLADQAKMTALKTTFLELHKILSQDADEKAAGAILGLLS